MNKFKQTAFGGILLLGLLGLVACGGNDGDGGGGGAGNPSAYPTGPDANETGVGNSSIATATAHALGDNTVNTIWPQGDDDYYAVDLVAGTQYELSANNLCFICIVVITLYDAGGTQLDTNNRYISELDARLLFTPAADGTYYVRVQAEDTTFGVAQYTIGVRVFTDADGDSFSTYYDCDDTDATIFPYATEIPADGIDQDCDGVDRLANTTIDSAEVDNTPAQAREMTVLVGNPFEIQYGDPIYTDNARTLHDAADEDWFTVTVPAYSFVVPFEVDGGGNFTVEYFEADATTPRSLFITNTTASPITYYVRISGSNAAGAWYNMAVYDGGQDLDEDGFYSQLFDSPARDCDDSDDTIFPGAIEIIGDGIDQDCDGVDGMLAPTLVPAPLRSTASGFKLFK